MAMKKLLLSSIAALFLTTGTAHAYNPIYYDCGVAFVKSQTHHGTGPSGRRVFPTTWTIQENWEKQDRENLPVISSLNFRCNKNSKCYFNGRFCRVMSDEEGHKEFPDAD